MSKFLSHCSYKWRSLRLPNIFKNEQTYRRKSNVGPQQVHVQGESQNSEVNQNKGFVTFLERISIRRAEAQRSVLIQVQSEHSFRELHSYCNSIGTVNQMFHYTTGVDPLHFIIVEFVTEEDVNNILSTSSYVEESFAVPTQTHFLWFKASTKHLRKLKQSKSAQLSIINGTKCVSEAEIKNNLSKSENISEQIKVLYDTTKLNDLGTRLRYLTTLQIENIVSGMFPYASAYPFGSSVNGYGKIGCDLDLALKLFDKKRNDESRLIFHSKTASGSERTMNQRHIELISDIIHLFLPGCTQVRRILQARVPIIKYHQHLTDVECDLSMTNMSGVHMSDFLYIMGELDDRVRPLVFAVRKWAKEVGLTNSTPGKWISNFSLTLLVLAFLQKPLTTSPILPSLNTLTKLAGPNDKYITEDGVNCTFLRDLNKLNFKTENTETLESLLEAFFQYYSQFDFSSKAVYLNEAVALTKPDFSPMYIVNPLERGLNVSKNVTIDEVERFKIEVRNAAWILDSPETSRENWGLLSILENKNKLKISNFSFSDKQSRLMNVSTLFENEETNIEFKNDKIKQEVENIKKNTKENINALKVGIKKQNSRR